MYIASGESDFKSLILITAEIVKFIQLHVSPNTKLRETVECPKNGKMSSPFSKV